LALDLQKKILWSLEENQLFRVMSFSYISKKGLSLWSQAKEVIPGGNGLLSKRPDRYTSDIWPTYFSKAKGCFIWDLDGNRYIDMAQNGIGTAILGYSDDFVNRAVKRSIDQGINTSLNPPEEVELAKKLLEINPKMGSVKFARGGGEAMSLAVRIGRAASNRDKVAFSGYHGWTDWYIATNLSSTKNLNEHLLPGLSPAGVPEGLKGTAIPFSYNNIKSLEDVLNQNQDIGVIVIEGARYDFPKKDFLDAIYNEAKKRKIIIIVDEITSGFRKSFGGVYRDFDFDPDIVVFGKALGNGFAISALVGKTHIMSYAQETFVSSTMWTERVGFVAALATLSKLESQKVNEHLERIGRRISDGWESISKECGIDISVTEYKPLISFKLNYGDKNNLIATLFIQEMQKRGFLAATSVYVTFSHTDEIIDLYLKNVKEVFTLIVKWINADNLENSLECSPRSDMFKRLN